MTSIRVSRLRRAFLTVLSDIPASAAAFTMSSLASSFPSASKSSISFSACSVLVVVFPPAPDSSSSAVMSYSPKVAFHLSGGIAAGRQSKIREGRGAWSVRRGCSLFPCEKFNGFGEALAEKLHDKINGAAAFALAVAIPFVSPDGQAVVPFPAVFLSGAGKLLAL